jgi:23S rRNA pseudouridine1911/1915/1917 synthase
VVAETKEYLVIDKPAGLLSHPTQAGEAWSLSHWVWKNYPKLKGIGEYDDRPGIVHRLDKDTSGLMVIAKTQEMFMHLKEQFKDRSVDKRYTTLVHGLVEAEIDVIDFDIDRGRDGRMVARPKTNVLLLKK